MALNSSELTLITGKYSISADNIISSYKDPVEDVLHIITDDSLSDMLILVSEELNPSVPPFTKAFFVTAVVRNDNIPLFIFQLIET